MIEKSKHRMKILLVAAFTVAASAGALVSSVHEGEAWGWVQPLDPPRTITA